LPTKYIIHCTGPDAKQYGINWELFRSCYNNILNLAKEQNIKEIAFCCISTGLYGYPKKDAANNAYTEVIDWLEKTNYSFNKIIFVTFTLEDYNLYLSLHKNNS
jgi:O-acetyl-ADP-ribose deacetylase (regulator of RNase III)